MSVYALGQQQSAVAGLAKTEQVLCIDEQAGLADHQFSHSAPSST